MSQEIKEKGMMNHFIQKSLHRGEMLAKDDGLRGKTGTKERTVLPDTVSDIAEPFRTLVQKSLDRAKVMSEDNGL